MISVRAEPDKNCSLCPRLLGFRQQAREKLPDGFNGAVPSWGNERARLLIIGLAPGLKGANFTGRPFTGDYAGDLLYKMLAEFDFTRGHYSGHADDNLIAVDVMISNAVRCVPPQNKPNAEEIRSCLPFLSSRIEQTGPKVILALGRLAHDSCVRALASKVGRYPFAHGRLHRIGRYILIDSYHCSRYNTNTGRLTEEMFRQIFQKVRAVL